MRLSKFLAALCLFLAVIGVGVDIGAPPASATGSGMFRAGALWTGQFGTPSLMKVGNTYWAYATTTGGDNLPAMHSTDLVHWRTRAAYPADANPGWWKGYNDALPHPARWALYYIHRNGRAFTSSWGPSVAYVGGQYVLAYAVSIGAPNRHCVSLATSRSPAGPFVDNTSAPIVCSPDPGGSIDPQILLPGDGKVYLIWKNAGVKGSVPTRVWARQMNGNALGFAPGSRARLLLATARPWEGNVIENPAMINYRGRYYLFYSGNNFLSTRYATGYAVCAGPLGPCRRPIPGPLLATGGRVAGPGSASPIVGPNGALRLAYAAWDPGHTSPADPVKMHVALLTVDTKGLLHVAWRG